MYYANTDLLIAFHCDHQVSYRYYSIVFNLLYQRQHSCTIKSCILFFHKHVDRYKYKFLRATTSNMPSSVTKDNRGSKLTIGRGGMLKVQHLVSVARPSTSHQHIDSAGYQQPSRIAYIEFFVKPEEDEDTVNDWLAVVQYVLYILHLLQNSCNKTSINGLFL